MYDLIKKKKNYEKENSFVGVRIAVWLKDGRIFVEPRKGYNLSFEFPGESFRNSEKKFNLKYHIHG